MSVKDGRIVLPSGMSYRVLALPGGKAMSPEVLERSKAWPTRARRSSPKPEKAPAWPATGVRRRGDAVAEGLWSKGVRDQSPADALAALGVPPDFACTNAQSRVMYIHRLVEGADVYFVSSQRPVADEVTCSFRVSGRAPELWHPDIGKIEPAPVFTRSGTARFSARLRFDPADRFLWFSARRRRPTTRWRSAAPARRRRKRPCSS
jgi:hypothetical protein